MIIKIQVVVDEKDRPVIDLAIDPGDFQSPVYMNFVIKRLNQAIKKVKKKRNV